MKHGSLARNITSLILCHDNNNATFHSNIQSLDIYTYCIKFSFPFLQNYVSFIEYINDKRVYLFLFTAKG